MNNTEMTDIEKDRDTSEYKFLKAYLDKGHRFVNFNDFYKAFNYNRFLVGNDGEDLSAFAKQMRENAKFFWDQFNKDYPESS